MEHADLISEMPHIEQMPTPERLVLAKRRRTQQLKIWQQREKEYFKKPLKMHKSNKRSIYFNDSVVLLEAATRNDIDEVRRLLMKGVNPDSCNEDGLTALHQCCIDNNESMLLLLLEYGANANSEDSEKWTPLHAAATCGHLKLVRILIARGANLLAVNADGNMPYDICEDEQALDYIESEMSKRGVTQELIDDTRAHTEKKMLTDLQRVAASNGDLEVHDTQGATPLHIAAANGYTSVVEFLLDHNVNTDVKDRDDWRPAHAAACWGHLEVLELLVQSGADLTAINKHEETPADICEDPELKDRIVQLKLEQETKRQAEAHKRTKVRRSQSSNTRTQSVRRTSLRDKGLTARRDAVEEARLRHQAEKGLNLEGTSVTSNGVQNGMSNNNNNSSSGDQNNERLKPSDGNALQVQERKDPDGKDDDRQTEEMIECQNEKTYTTDVNDLKKQRMQIRNSSATDVNSLNSPVSTISDGDSMVSQQATNADIVKFTTDEIVGAEKPRKCCVIQ
ncbi:PREDICTED: protein phosphatase 1 regulatory inhibitor subunit 16B isoform X2 [Nicrophorus vespilloides]|uniref:Protein phosphatase 1 regulatory inhibitor subunit 16B isoform X2 n=1 Tax=Nicrophorus vespilloides TaxID=110193 RepID=A0ABM1MQ43_NICVS|nr:PREDICTED: protein phosphatase 1 regulatory inhibitor subunit 16B isoform X2 [Nicrophorus vespilloides]